MANNYEKFGNYILLERLQTGGMAEIYLARRPGAKGVSKFMAIKRILPQFSEQQEFIDMFQDEAKIAVNLNHANIVSIHEFGIQQNQLFLAMDYVEGKNLRQILQKMKKSGVSFTTEHILYVIKEVANGLDHAHRCIDSNTGKPLNIIHRDMSPQNIMISFEGEVKIVDFGIAKAETQAENTRAGTLKGKFGYMSPEQADAGQVDKRTDIFALGIILWELLANDRLFTGKNEVETIRRVKECQVTSLRKVNTTVSPELERIVNKALAKDRNLRYSDAAAFHRDLNRFMNKQFPDFSPHDFSKFVKTLFNSEIIESRKKMVEYSQIESAAMTPAPRSESAPAPSAPSASKKGDKMSAPEFQTATEQTTGPSGPVARPKAVPPKVPQEAQSSAKTPTLDSVAPSERPKKVPRPATVERHEINAPKSADTSSLSVDRRSLREAESRENGTNYGTRAGGTNSSYRTTFTPERSSSSSVAAFMLFASVLIVFAAMNREHLPPGLARTLDNMGIEWIRKEILGSGRYDSTPIPTPIPNVASDNFQIEVITTPLSGAEIFLDGKQVSDTTPAHFEVPKNSHHRILVRKTGYMPVERDLYIDQNTKIEVPLTPEKQGFLTVVVRGAGEIYIDNKKVATGSPLMDFPVKANQDLTVRAFDPVSKYIDERKIKVGENAHVKVILGPHPPLN